MPKICISLAPSSFEDLLVLLGSVNKKTNDFVEVRFDYMNKRDIQEVIAKKILEKVRSRAIFTLRPISEGGNFMDNPSERVKILKILGLAYPMLLDVEFNLLKENKGLTTFIQQNKIPIMVSWHNLARTPTIPLLTTKIHKMKKYSNILKVVTRANKLQDAITILSVYDTIKNVTLIAFAMGELGVLSRVLCTVYGNAPFTYASFNRSTAPGQINIESLRKLYYGLCKNCD
jgi:3-dehydroquinate dehydratase-1